MNILWARLSETSAIGRLLVVAVMVPVWLAATALPARAQVYPPVEYLVGDRACGQAYGEIRWSNSSVTVRGRVSDSHIDGSGVTVLFDLYHQSLHLGTHTRTAADGAGLSFDITRSAQPGGVTRIAVHLRDAADSCGQSRVYERPER